MDSIFTFLSGLVSGGPATAAPQQAPQPAPQQIQAGSIPAPIPAQQAPQPVTQPPATPPGEGLVDPFNPDQTFQEDPAVVDAALKAQDQDPLKRGRAKQLLPPGLTSGPAYQNSKGQVFSQKVIEESATETNRTIEDVIRTLGLTRVQ